MCDICSCQLRLLVLVFEGVEHVHVRPGAWLHSEYCRRPCSTSVVLCALGHAHVVAMRKGLPVQSSAELDQTEAQSLLSLCSVTTMVNATEDENNGNRLKGGKQAFAQSIHYPTPGVRDSCMSQRNRLCYAGGLSIVRSKDFDWLVM